MGMPGDYGQGADDVDALALTCDACKLAERRCPGLPAHCARGEHCTDVDATCARDDGHDDHGPYCCFCGRELRLKA